MDAGKAERILKDHVPVGRRIMLELEVFDSTTAIDTLLDPMWASKTLCGCHIVAYRWDASFSDIPSSEQIKISSLSKWKLTEI